MFPLFNLDAHGLGGSADRGMGFWLDSEGILGLTNEGMVMPVAPGTETWCRAAARVLARRRLIGVLGDAGPVHGVLAAAGLSRVPCRMSSDEPHFSLDLARLRMPDAAGCALVPLGGAWRGTATAWRQAYAAEVLGETEESAAAIAEASVASFIERDSHRILVRDGEPVAMTGVNAELPGIVQIGGVFTPPELRGRGHAHRAVALHLQEAQGRGVREATLFAASDMAARAYVSLGFERIGTFSLVLFDGPQEVRHG